ncbi:MAG: UDP-N-acetylmuramoyl-L-alanyl-D-glutamate--2,6-diaminopimelate ligase [Pseudomonadota bacterium]
MTQAMSLKSLLESINVSFDLGSDVMIQDVAIDSRKVGVGTLFCAYPGAQVDGRDFIAQAVQAGASAVLCEAADFEPLDISVPVIVIPGLQMKVGLLAHHFFSEPSESLQVFGVTGTNGKTTCCYLLTQALTDLGLEAAMIGTIGMGRLADLSGNSLTTPDPVAVHRCLAEFRDQGITQVCMEVSSHALDQGRVAGVSFFCTLFTNLSHDHLDYHGDMASYAQAKQQLFTDYPSELVITNADDELGASLIDVANSEFIASYGDAGDVRASDIVLTEGGINIDIEANGVEFDVQTPLVGKVNIPNVLMLVTTLLSLSTDIEDIQRIIAGLDPAPGRMELYVSDKQPRVVIDYAHTPDALEKALLSVREHCRGDLWCVFGCGGDRDTAKRPVMGAAANKYADQIVVTNDNPRSEDAAAIAADIVAGIDREVVVVLDRAEAIRTAIETAQADDWVVVAGKGHETTQQIGSDYLPFSDREQVATILGVAA